LNEDDVGHGVVCKKQIVGTEHNNKLRIMAWVNAGGDVPRDDAHGRKNHLAINARELHIVDEAYHTAERIRIFGR